MSLPSSRNRTYAIGSQVYSADLNDIQDAIIGLHDLTRGSVKKWLHPARGFWSDDNVAGNLRFSAAFMHGAVRFTSTSGGGGWGSYIVPLDVVPGDRITRVSAFVQNGVTDVLNLDCLAFDSTGGAPLTIGSTASSTDHASAIEELVIGSLTETVVDGYWYALRIYCTAFANSPILNGCTQTTDHPL